MTCSTQGHRVIDGCAHRRHHWDKIPDRLYIFKLIERAMRYYTDVGDQKEVRSLNKLLAKEAKRCGVTIKRQAVLF